MPVFKLPLSGDVVQSINPWTSFFSPSGGQYGLVNINLGQSSEPKIEAEVLSDVASYGKQLGQIGDALIVLLKYLPEHPPLNHEDKAAIDALKKLLDEIADKKRKAWQEGDAPISGDAGKGVTRAIIERRRRERLKAMARNEAG